MYIIVRSTEKTFLLMGLRLCSKALILPVAWPLSEEAVLGFLRGKPRGCVYICVHVHTHTKMWSFWQGISLRDYRGWAANRMRRRASVWFQFMPEGLRTTRVNGVNSILKAGSLETRRGQMFQSESEGQGRPMSQRTDRKLGILSYSVSLFYSGLQWIEWGPCTFVRTICFTPSIDFNVNLNQKHPHRHKQK